MSDMSIKYNGVDVTYNESKNRWEFELRGRGRFAESLSKAKEAIDKPAPIGKITTGGFERIQAYLDSYYASFTDVEVTSVAVPLHKWSSPEVWVTKLDDKTRQKSRLSSVYPKNPVNDPLVVEYRALERQVKSLKEKMDALKVKMVSLEIPAEE